MPSWTELQHFLAHGATTPRLREDAALEHLHRSTTRTQPWPSLAVLAFDHRAQFEELARAHDAPAERIVRFKALIAEAAWQAGGAGAIVDDRYGEAVLPDLTEAGWWIARPVEAPGSRPLRFDTGVAPALTLRSWPTAHVAKCLVSWHPDDPAELRAQQVQTLRELQDACIATGREWLLEVIPPREMSTHERTIARALDQLYGAGLKPDWWKLPPPTTAATWNAIEAAIERHDPHCRGVLLLGLEASEDDLASGFRLAAPHRCCKGFAVGRSIFAEAAALWFAGEREDDAVVADIAARYRRLIQLWREVRAQHEETSE
jgi:5-dehydro-2-deoxygluconokinase